MAATQRASSIRGWAWGALLVISLGLAGCTTPVKPERTDLPQLGLEAFPPVANDQAPGASAEAWRMARALGRGINFGNMLDAPNEGDWGIKVEPDYADQVVKAGFATVRLPVRWSNHAEASPPFKLDAVFVDQVEAVVDQLLAKGLYVVMDMHHDRPFEGRKPDPGEKDADPARLDERFLRLWAQVSQRFKGKSDKLLFEVYNEPHGRLNADRWNDLLARAVGVIRQHNPQRVLVISGAAWGGVWGLAPLRVPNDPHLIVSFHHYEPMAFTHQGASWHPEYPAGATCCDAAQTQKITQAFDMAKAWGDQNRYPVFLGEFGSHDKADMPSRVAYARAVREQAEKRGIPWAVWEFGSSFGVYDRTAAAWRADLLKALQPSP